MGFPDVLNVHIISIVFKMTTVLFRTIFGHVTHFIVKHICSLRAFHSTSAGQYLRCVLWYTRTVNEISDAPHMPSYRRWKIKPSWHGSLFHITNLLWGEYTGDPWIPFAKAQQYLALILYWHYTEKQLNTMSSYRWCYKNCYYFADDIYIQVNFVDGSLVYLVLQLNCQ